MGILAPQSFATQRLCGLSSLGAFAIFGAFVGYQVLAPLGVIGPCRLREPLRLCEKFFAFSVLHIKNCPKPLVSCYKMAAFGAETLSESLAPLVLRMRKSSLNQNGKNGDAPPPYEPPADGGSVQEA